MVAQYLIDWASIASRVDRATATEAMELRWKLNSLRQKIETNGVVIMDDDSRLIEKLQSTIVFLKTLTEESNEEEYSNLILALESFQNVYENRQYYVKAADSRGALPDCIDAWNDHVRPISPQGITGGVVITDNGELALGTLESETIDSYETSETECLRRNWSSGRSYNAGTQKEFIEYLNAFAATSSGEVLFVDPYWGSAGQSTEAGGESAQQKRYLHATVLFAKPFMMNSDVERIDFLTEYPKDPNDRSKECVCFCTDKLCNRLSGLVAVRRGDLVMNVEFVEPLDRSATFHNRYLVNETYTMSLLNGIDVCDTGGRMGNFEVQLFGQSGRGDKLKRGKVTNYRKRTLKPEEVDLQKPYVRIIKDKPFVRFTVNG